MAHHYLGSAYAMKGNTSEALAEYQKARQLNPDGPHVVALLARLYAISGKRDEALRTLAHLRSMATQRYVPDYSIALVYAALGEKDQAFELLEKSYWDHTVDISRFTMIRLSTTFVPIHALRICSGALG